MAYILFDENSIYYECGYSCDNSIYLSLGDVNYFFTDSRYDKDANDNVKNAEVVIGRDILKMAIKYIKNARIKKLKFDPYELDIYSYLLLKKLDVVLLSKARFSFEKRIIKSTKQIKLIEIAMQKARDGFGKFANYLKMDGIGKTECHLAFKTLEFLTDFGKYETSFDPIVAIGKNSAKPHAKPTDNKYKKNSLLLFDGGIKYKRYCSDRTVTYGQKFNSDKTQRKQKFKTNRHQKIYDIVLKAQEKAISGAKTGMKASQIDKIARDTIQNSGYGNYFIHSTGHGVGLDIHEYPIISQKSDTIIKDGMVFTIEPGIYLPDDFGIRIEDTVVMQNGIAKIL